MDENLSQLKTQIEKIASLVPLDNWGPEYQLWKQVTEKLVREIFGEEKLRLFKQQQTVVFSYIDDSRNSSQYIKELSNRKKILVGLLAGTQESKPKEVVNHGKEKILKEIWQKEEALRENLLLTEEAESFQKSLIETLEDILPAGSIPGLRLRKIKAEKRFQNWWSDENGYPIDNSWEKIVPFLKLLEQHEAEKTIKVRLETEGLFVESRSQGEDQHLLIGDKNDKGEKAHLIIDGKNAEIRVEDNQKAPEDLLAKIETVLTLHSGKKIRTTRELIEEV